MDGYSRQEVAGRAGVNVGYVDRLVEGMVVIRLEPGRLRTWDFADDYAVADEA